MNTVDFQEQTQKYSFFLCNMHVLKYTEWPLEVNISFKLGDRKQVKTQEVGQWKIVCDWFSLKHFTVKQNI